MKNSKAVLERLWSLRGLKHNLVQHLSEVVAGTEAAFGPGAGIHAKGLVDLGLARLDLVGARLSKADIDNVIEGTDDALPRSLRDELVEKVRSLLMSLFSAVSAGWGQATANGLGLGAVPEQADAVLRMALTVLEHWAKQTLPAPQNGMVIDVAPTVELLRATSDDLAGALDKVALEVSEAQTALEAKKAAIAEFDRVFTAIAREGSNLLILAGKDVLAQQLKPSMRRPGRTHAVAEGLEDVPEDLDDAAPAADAPAPTPAVEPEPV